MFAVEHLKSQNAFSAEQLEAMFDPMNHIGVSGEIVDEAVELARSAIK